MAWRDDVREFAKLDGLEFAYEDVTETGGADGVVHNIATSGRPVYEGISKGAEVFNVSALFVGEEYLSNMDDMIDILQKPKSHQFKHPYRGNFKVALVPPGYTLSNRRTESGMCRFTFKLIVLEDQIFPLIRDARTDVFNQLNILNLALLDSYGRRFKVGTFVKQILGTIGLATAAMRNVEGKIQAAMNISQAFGSAVTGFADQAASLLRKPQDMITSLTSTAIGLIGGIVTSADDLPSRNSRAQTTFTQSMRAIFDAERPVAGATTTPESDLEQENSIQWWLANRIAFISGAAEAILDMTFTSSDQVQLFLSEFLGFFDAVTLDPALDDQAYTEIRQLKATVVAFLTSVAQELPELTTYTTHKSLPALVVSYQIYGNTDENLQIVDRNNVTHPMFVPPRTLEVIGGI